jgi:ssDNA-binding Zn-finger/Zn-ribbon topoisomerase 1
MGTLIQPKLVMKKKIGENCGDITFELGADMIDSTWYKCPNCKHLIQLRNADFIKGIAMVSCMDCGRGAFAIEETLLR